MAKLADVARITSGSGKNKIEMTVSSLKNIVKSANNRNKKNKNIFLRRKNRK